MPRRALNARPNTAPIQSPAGPRTAIMTQKELRDAIERLAENSGKKSLEETREKIGKKIRLAISSDRPGD